MSKTLGLVALTYDIKSKHTEVKDAMRAKGWSSAVTISNASHQLPSTTLAKSNTSTEQAILDIRAVCQALSVTLERAIAVIASDWVAI